MLHIRSLENDSHVKKKNIYLNRLSFHKVEWSDLTNVLNATLMILSSITFSCSLCLRLEKNKYTFGSVGVFHQQGPCTWSMPCLYEQDTLRAKHGGVFQLPDSTKWRIWIYEHKHTEEDAANAALRTTGQTKKTLVTPYQEVQMSRSTPNSNDAPKE